MKPPRNSGTGIQRTMTRRLKGRPLFPGVSLEDLRYRRELAIADGDMTLAFTLACEIDRKRGLY